MDMTAPPQTADLSSAPYLTAPQVADLLQVSTWTIYEWARLERIPHHRILGRTLRFDPAEIKAWVADGGDPL